MKNKVLKTVCGVMLSAMLVITVAIPVLADCTITHSFNVPAKITYPYADEHIHQIKIVTEGTCVNCGEYAIIDNTYTENHTLGADGKCIKCRYQVWHKP